METNLEITVQDNLNLQNNSYVKQIMMKESEESPTKEKQYTVEQVYFSGKVKKFNKKGSCKERMLLITDKFVYNLSHTFFGKAIKVNRQLPIRCIDAVSVCHHDTHSDEFIIHVKQDYDYRFSSKAYKN